MKDVPSPNFNARDPSAQPRLIVLHYTGMVSAQEALARLCDPGSEVSAHYMIDEDGELTQLVHETKRAWHAGRAYWAGERDINSASIGIELVNPGHAYGYRPFPKQQITTLKGLLHDLFRRWSLPPSCLLGHSDIAPTRKQDPGEYFPWHELADERLGLWPEPLASERGPIAPGEAYDLLRKIGYECPEMDDNICLAALHAFQRHYHPEALMDEETPETLARLRALARLLGV